MGESAASVLDEGLYQRLAGLVSADSPERGPGHLDLRPAVEQALYHEARLLDDRQYRAWLERFTEDCIYWIPPRSLRRPPHEGLVPARRPPSHG